MTLTYTKFDTWANLLAHVSYGAPVHYHAPLDTHPTRVTITAFFKNGKLRVEPTSSMPTFTADETHLERFCVQKWNP